MPETDPLMRISQMAGESGVSTSYLRGEIKVGRLPAMRLRGSRVLLVRRSDFERWLSSRLEPLNTAAVASRRAAARALAEV